MRLYSFILAIVLLAAMQLADVAGRARQFEDHSVINRLYRAADSDVWIHGLNARPDGHDCKLIGTYAEGHFALSEAACADGSFVEIGYRETINEPLRMITWFSDDRASRVRQEDLINELGAPQWDAFFLISRRGHI